MESEPTTKEPPRDIRSIQDRTDDIGAIDSGLDEMSIYDQRSYSPGTTNPDTEEEEIRQDP